MIAPFRGLVFPQVIQDQPWTAARRRTAVLRFLTAKLQAPSEQLQLEGARGLLELAINREHHNEVDHACLAALVARMCSPNVEVGWWWHQQLAAGRQQDEGVWLYTIPGAGVPCCAMPGSRRHQCRWAAGVSHLCNAVSVPPAVHLRGRQGCLFTPSCPATHQPPLTM